jgi:hypothetical protein
MVCDSSIEFYKCLGILTCMLYINYVKISSFFLNSSVIKVSKGGNNAFIMGELQPIFFLEKPAKLMLLSYMINMLHLLFHIPQYFKSLNIY